MQRYERRLEQLSSDRSEQRAESQRAEPRNRSHTSSAHQHTVWEAAAAHCVNGTRNRPEAILHVVQQQFKLRVRLIGNGSRGSLIDVHKEVAKAPDAGVWHSHNMISVLRWLASKAAPENAYQREGNTTRGEDGASERIDSRCPCQTWNRSGGRKVVQC